MSPLQQPSSPRLIYLVTEDHYFYSHRLPMARAAQRAGFDVALAANVRAHGEAIAREGIRLIPLSLERKSLNPFKAIRHILQIYNIYRREKPDIVHHIAMKPVLYGGIAAWMAGVPVVVNAFAGLGYVFTARRGLAWALRSIMFPLLLRPVMKRRGSYLLLQNRDDLALLRAYGMAPTADRVVVIGGSGIDLERCVPQPLPQDEADGARICVFAGRLIEIKGLAMLKEAFAILKDRGVALKLWLCGLPDEANPSSWTMDDIEQWVAGNDNVAYKGFCKDMREIWAQAHMAVQPSLGGEGVPKSLLEAGACGRAIVATDVPGCRELVDGESNGFLVSAHDAVALANALEKLAATDNAVLAEKGMESRRLVESRGFSADNVSRLTEAMYRRCIRLQGMADEVEDLQAVVVNKNAYYGNKAS